MAKHHSSSVAHENSSNGRVPSSTLTGDMIRLFSAPIELVPNSPNIVDHKTIMTSGKLHAEQQLAGALTPQAIRDLVKLRPSDVTAGNARSAIKKVKHELMHGHSITKVFETLRNAYETFLMPIAMRPDSMVSNKHAHEAGRDLAKLISPAVVKDLVDLAPKDMGRSAMRASIHELKTELKSGQGLVPWLNSVSDMGGHHTVYPIFMNHLGL